MKVKKNLSFLSYLFFSIILNVYLFIVNYINYDSTRGTDFNKYRTYLDYYLFGKNIALEEQGVGYYWLISQISKTKINSLKNSVDFESIVLNFGIQTGNFIFFTIGCIGIYFLLRYLKLSPLLSLTVINIISIFPPIVGARLILKPEILAFAYLPWCILIIYKFLDSHNFKLLYILAAPVAITISLKASITLMVALSLLIFVNKKLLNINLIAPALSLVLIFSLLIHESETVNEKYLWETSLHKNSYDNVAPLSFLVHVNDELFTNPYRDTQSSSMLGILLLDTFGDYWQRYWFHEDAWLNNQHKGNLFSVRVGLLISLGFYSYLIFLLLKERDKKLKKIGMLAFIGIFTLLVSVFNIFPFLTKNFNPSKGDPIKTHYFSFLICFSLIYVTINLLKSNNKFLSYSLLSFVFIFSLNLQKSISFDEVKSNQIVMNKIHLLSPCSLGDPITNFINYSSGWCSMSEVAQSVCEDNYNKQLTPLLKDGYLIYPPDETYTSKNLIYDNNTVTVANYYECLNYVESGYLPENAKNYFFKNSLNIPYIFISVFLFSKLSFIFFAKYIKEDIY